MAIGRLEKNKEQVSSESTYLLTTEKDSDNVERGIVANKKDPMNEFQKKVNQAIKANDLCYNCETGFHYME
ncbi:hypothetical protein UF75_0850 [Desulfosporosinus sp. I2]|uniref:hypothetical protein n=1 Tax=Desulfosporosinus sp. I2 TaxID=1617025 RepID=UPI0005F036E9|nr:hypothetical protein [Desulfosporosinus sp. I2]KJR48799.1 hypothetical protein UF75_0850 [Desulfosporosinus sp. I2]